MMAGVVSDTSAPLDNVKSEKQNAIDRTTTREVDDIDAMLIVAGYFRCFTSGASLPVSGELL